jgi:2-methylcitrate dehydratase PrpD
MAARGEAAMPLKKLGHVVLASEVDMEPVLAALARVVSRLPEEAIIGAVRDRAALVLADTVGAILGGAQEPEVRRLHAGAERAVGPATVLGEAFPRVEPWWAITANGLAGTMLELDEGNRFARGHPGIHVLPAALAEAERLGRPGSALLSALVVGYDVAARLGAGAPIRPGMHMHGVHGAVGAAAAVARLRELDEDVTARALGVGAGLTLGTSWRTALGGATVRNAYAGVAGANGWLAVDLGVAGVTALPDMLSEIFGRISGSAFDAAAILDGLGERFEISRNYFKRYACCRYNHPAVEAIEEILAETPIAPDRIASIRVATSALGATMSERDPSGALGAKFSIPYSLAVRLVLGEWDDCGVEAFREPALSDARVRALARRVEVVEDLALTALTPRVRPARVEVRLTDGRVLARQVDQPSGEFDRPYPESALRAKFVGLAAASFGGPGAGAAWDLCRRVGDLKSARELTDGLRVLALSRRPH